MSASVGAESRTGCSVKPIPILAAVLCLAGSWFYAISIASLGGVGLKPGHANDYFPTMEYQPSHP